MEDADFEADGAIGGSGPYDYDRMQAAREAASRTEGLAQHEYMAALDAARAVAPQVGFDLGYSVGVRTGLALGALRGLLWYASNC